MPTPGSQVAVDSTSPHLLAAAEQHAQTVVVRNAGTANSAYIGDATVTAPGGANPGFELVFGAQMPVIQLDPEETIYAICAAGLTTRVDVFQSYSA